MKFSPNLEEKAALFVLDLLDRPERAEFANLLAKDPDLRSLVDEMQEGLSLYAAAESRPESPSADVEERLMLGIRGGGAATGPVDIKNHKSGVEPARSKRSVVARAQGWFWPAAAMVMLGVNLFLTRELWEARSDGDAAADTGVRVDASVLAQYGIAREGRALARHLESMHTERDRLRARMDDAVSETGEAWERVRLLELSNQSLVEEREIAFAAYEDLAEHAAPLMGGHPGFARYTVMELLPANADVTGPLGLARRAGSLLQRPGIALLDRDGIPDAAPSGANAAAPFLEESGSPIAFDEMSFALSVFDETTGRGFMDVHNLPEAAEGEAFYLWMRGAAGDTGFVALGGLPAGLAGRSGSLFFEVPPGTLAPVEIIITAEEDATPSAPEGPVVLRGP